MSDRFLVLGASGQVGGHVLEMLRQDGREAVGASRTPKDQHWVRFDWLDQDTFSPALQGITTVLLECRPGDEDADRYAAPFISAMVDAGVRRVVLLSALGAAKRPEFSLRKVELLVEASGLAWTHIRPNFFFQMLARPPLSSEIALHGTLSLPLGDARIAYVDADDVAALLFKALTDQSLAGRAIELSGPEALTHEEIVQHIAQQTGRAIRFVNLSEDEARALLLSRGFPPSHTERVMRFYSLCRQGYCAAPDTEAGQILGRPLNHFETFVEANQAAWQLGATSHGYTPTS
jgi:uncharacterized protein YbjT (DUF2867 family)